MEIRKRKINVRIVVIMGLMIAMQIILTRFLSIQAWNIKIGFGFIPIVITAIVLGPVEAGITAGIADFLGTIMFPIGPYFPGFTLTQVAMGITWGLFLNKKMTLPRTIGACAVNNFVFSLFLNTLWISILYGSPYIALIPTRVMQAAFLFCVDTMIIIILKEVLFKRIKVLFENPLVS